MAVYTTIGEYLKSKSGESRHMTDYFYAGMLANDKVLLRVTDDSILNPYDSLLDNYRIEYTFTDEEYRKYKYNPWKCALDAYGSTEYWFLIVHSNELYSANEFNMKTVSVYTQDVIPFIDEILAISGTFIKQEKHKAEKMQKSIEFQLESATNQIYSTNIVKTYSY